MFDDDLGLDDGDLDLGGEVSESRIQRLIEGKRRLEAKMAVSGAREQRRIARYLSRIEKVLDKSNYISTVRRKPLVDGVSGMVFENQPPPGPGRLSRGQTDLSALYVLLWSAVSQDRSG